MDLQDLIAVVVAGIAAAYVFRAVRRALLGKRCACGAGGCPSERPIAAPCAGGADPPRKHLTGASSLPSSDCGAFVSLGFPGGGPSTPLGASPTRADTLRGES